MQLHWLHPLYPRLQSLLCACSQQLLRPSFHCQPNRNFSSGFSNGTTADIDSGAGSAGPIISGHGEVGAHRRGFGPKVTRPKRDVLHQVLVDQSATINFRAYHLGSRIHIGRILELLEKLPLPPKTISGKDYCIIYLQPNTLGLYSSTKEAQARRWSLRNISWAMQVLLKRLPSQHGLQPQSSRLPPPQQQRQQQGPQQQQQRQQPQVQAQPHVHPRRFVFSPKLMPEWPPVLSSDLLPQRPLVPPLMVMAIFRSGSVVFAGTRQRNEASLIDRFVPSSVHYRPKEQVAWPVDRQDAAGPFKRPGTRPPPVHLELADVHRVVIDPDLTEDAVKGVDQVHLRLLDVGGVRVITSVLAQSAALQFYERSVRQSLESLADWRATRGHTLMAQRGWGLGTLSSLVSSIKNFFSGKQEIVLFKVIAASDLVISEARQLLEMAEPAWEHSTYHKIWELTADDFELESRFKSLEKKLTLVEEEAKFDVKDRAGRRYQRLEQSVMWLLVVSCVLTAIEVWRKKKKKEALIQDSSTLHLSDNLGHIAAVADETSAWSHDQASQSSAQLQEDSRSLSSDGIAEDSTADISTAAGDAGYQDATKAEDTAAAAAAAVAADLGADVAASLGGQEFEQEGSGSKSTRIASSKRLWWQRWPTQQPDGHEGS